LKASPKVRTKRGEKIIIRKNGLKEKKTSHAIVGNLGKENCGAWNQKASRQY